MDSEGIRFEFEWDDITKMVVLNDKHEGVVIVMTLEQIEALLGWYCEKFGKMVI